MDMAIVLQKPMDQSKSRLQGILSPEERIILAESMLFDTLNIIRQSSFDRVVLLTCDRKAIQLANDFQVEVLYEHQVNGMNQALKSVIDSLDSRVNRLFIFPSDIPFIRVEDIDRLILTKRTPVTVVPCRKGKGTNTLVLSPPQVIPTAFGMNSKRKHCEMAESLGIKYTLYYNKRLSFDIDTMEDLLRAYDYCEEGTKTTLFFQSYDFFKNRRRNRVTI